MQEKAVWMQINRRDDKKPAKLAIEPWTIADYLSAPGEKTGEIDRMNGLVRIISLLALVALAASGCTKEQDVSAEAKIGRLAPAPAPATRTVDQVDDYFGVKVADPYRWLEDLDSAETAGWVAAENTVSQPYLEGLPGREKIKARLTELWNYERVGIPVKEGNHYFVSRNDGLQDQDVLYVSDTTDDKGRVLIDPNGFSEDRTASLHSWTVSPDGSLITYAVSESGSDWTDLKIRDVASGKDLPDALTFIKFGGYNIAWDRDASGFYYSRYPQGADGKRDDRGRVTLYHHRLGTAQADDALVYEIPDHPRQAPSAEMTLDGAYLVINVFESYLANAIHVVKLKEPDAPVIKLLDKWDGLYSYLGSDGAELYFMTTNGAPKGRVIAVNVDKPDPANWREIIPESTNRLEAVSMIGTRLVAEYLVDAHSQILVFGRDGTPAGQVPLPGIGSTAMAGGQRAGNALFYSYTGFTTPGRVYRHDLEGGQNSLYHAPKTGLALDSFETEQIFYASKDGTRVPMFIVHKKGLEKNGDNPTLLYGYGGFDISLTPRYSTAWAVWLEMGGVLAIPNLRGGGEYGADWHKAGANLNKQNVFDDFIAAAEWLIANKYTATPRLAINGASNGGLLVGAVLTQRPDLFGVTAPAVGVMDILRYHTASVNARNWKSDYGLSENEDEFRAQYAYSPLQNVHDGVCYPPTLVTTADHDDRVVPWHSFKFGARLQAAQGCANPVLVRVETRAGHGAGKPTWMRIEEVADLWAFLAAGTGMTVAPGS